MMKSYLLAPEAHEQAQSIKGMMGGPFINIDRQHSDKIAQLTSDLESDVSSIFKLCDAIAELEKNITNSTGQSLESKYREIPEQIKGMVELFYDHNNMPSVRYFEKLLYEYYYSSEITQSGCLLNSSSDYRPFLLNTPRIEDKQNFFVNKELSSPCYDKLFASRVIPVSIGELAEELNLNESARHRFDDFFSNEPPGSTTQEIMFGSRIRVRYYGHATILLETNDVKILVDPVISYKSNSSQPRFTYSDLPDHIDYVLLTHTHQDHISLETLIQLRHKIGTILVPSNNNGALLDPSIKLGLKYLGFNSVIELSPFDGVNDSNMEIVALPFIGEHADLNIHSKCIYYVRLLQSTFLFAVDTNNLDNALFCRLKSQIKKLDYLFIGMEFRGAPLSWLYGPLMQKQLTRDQDRSRRLSGSDANKAWQIVQTLSPKFAYVYALGQEPWLNYLMALDQNEKESPIVLEANKFVSKCQEHGIVSERLYLQKEFFAEH